MLLIYLIRSYLFFARIPKNSFSIQCKSQIKIIKIEYKMIVPNYFPKKKILFPKKFYRFVKYSIFPNYFPKKKIYFPKQLYIFINC